LTPKRFQEIRDLFEAALERPPAEREQFVISTSGEDLELRAEVLQMLRAEAEPAGPIDDPALAAFRPVTSETQPADSLTSQGLEGRRIGQYLLQRCIGSGGMGTVYLATRDDDAFQKNVAVKVVTPPAGSLDLLRHFQRERQILATLDHPNIARLLDGGTTADGLPYLVMEYIEGQPIDEYCNERRLGIIERLKLFRVVCDAVHYAHQNLVVHRDLKPRNILVSSRGTVKLLDFGIAKLLSPEQENPTTALTRTAISALTPEYASPEQFKGEAITTAADVYSLGVVLYELLTGQRPYRLKSRVLHEIARVICEEDPTQPSAVVNEGAAPESMNVLADGKPERLRRRLRGDLDNILLMALRKEPRRRYASVQQFDEDLKRHLEGIPVTARKSTFIYRAARFVRRHRMGVAASALFLMALAAAMAATSWFAYTAAIERRRAEQRERDTRQLAVDLLKDVDPVLRALPGSGAARGRVLSNATKILDNLNSPSPRPSIFELPVRSVVDVLFAPARASADKELPAGWDRGGWNPTVFEIRTDREVVHRGRASGCIFARNGEEGDWATLVQTIRADRFRGRRVRLSAFLRSENVWEGAALWMSIDGIDGRLAFDGMKNRLVRGTTDWRRYEIVLDVPEESTALSFGLLLIGGSRGKAWIDDVTLEMVSNDEPVTEAEYAPARNVPKIPALPVNQGLEL
jgi:serine/threonine protein kinase